MQQVCLIHVQNCFHIIDYPSEGPTPPKSYDVFTQSTDQQCYFNSSLTKHPLDICKEATSPFLLWKVQDHKHGTSQMKRLSPPNTQHLSFFTRKKESLKVKAIPHIHFGKAL